MRKKSKTIRLLGWKGLFALAALLTGYLGTPGFVRAEKPCFLDCWLQWVAEMQASENAPTTCKVKDRCGEFACQAKSGPCETACRAKAGGCETRCQAKSGTCASACSAKCGTCETSCAKSKPVYAVRVLQARVDPCDHCPCTREKKSGGCPVNRDDVHFRVTTFAQQANHPAMLQNKELHQVIKNQTQQIQQLSNNMENLLREIQSLQQQVQALRNQPPLFVPPPPPSYPPYPQPLNPYYPPTPAVQYMPSSYQGPGYPVPAPVQMIPASYPGYNYLVPAPAPQPYPLPPQPAVPPAVPVTSTTDPMLPPANSSLDFNSAIGLFR